MVNTIIMISSFFMFMLFRLPIHEGYRLSSHLFPLFVWSQIEKATQIIVMSVDVNIAMLFTH